MHPVLQVALIFFYPKKFIKKFIIKLRVCMSALHSGSAGPHRCTADLDHARFPDQCKQLASGMNRPGTVRHADIQPTVVTVVSSVDRLRGRAV